MSALGQWGVKHPWLFWITAVVIASILGSIPGVGPVLFLASLAATGWWWAKSRSQQRAVAGAPTPHSAVNVAHSRFAPPGALDQSPAASRLLTVTDQEQSSTAQGQPSRRAVPVVGVDHYGGWGRARGEVEVALVREPRNPHDSNAVAVYFGRSKIGHLSRTQALLTAPAMDAAGLARVSAQAQLAEGTATVTVPDSVNPSLAPSPETLALGDFTPWGGCEHEHEVFYEADHRREIRQVFDDLETAIPPDGGVVKAAQAHLVQSSSPHALAVLVEGHWVGNLIGPDAASYAGPVRALAQRGLKMQVFADVWARNDHGTVRANVRLLLPRADELDPPGPMPSGAHILLPRGRKVQVTGEEKFLKEVSGLLVGRSERGAVATLHIDSPAGAGKERIEVRIYEETVGYLTPYMSEYFLPLVKPCDTRGVTVACHAAVRGNQIKADVVLDTARASDLSDEWIRDHVYGPAEGSSLNDDAVGIALKPDRATSDGWSDGEAGPDESSASEGAVGGSKLTAEQERILRDELLANDTELSQVKPRRAAAPAGD